MLRELLFVNEPAADFDITKTKMSVDDILRQCQTARLENFTVQSSISDLTSNKTQAFKVGKHEKREKKQEREEALAKWYGMRKQDPDAEENAELTIFRLRKHLQPGNFVRSDGLTKNPKYYEIGTIIDHGNFGKKKASKRIQKSKTLLDELAGKDDEVGFTKRKFRQIQDDKMKRSRNKRYVKLKRDMLKDRVKKMRKNKSSTDF